MISEKDNHNIEKIKFIIRNDNDDEIIMEYDQNVKFGKIREDIFLSQINTIDERNNFGLKLFINNVNQQKDEIDLSNRKDLDTHRLNKLNFKPEISYIITIYDLTTTFTPQMDRCYRIGGSIIIVFINMMYYGIIMKVLLWMCNLLMKLLFMIKYPPQFMTKKRTQYSLSTVLNNGIYEWLFLELMTYDLYNTFYEISQYNILFIIFASLCIYHSIKLYRRNSQNVNIKQYQTNKIKSSVLELLFMLVMFLMTNSIYQTIYIILNVSVIIFDVYEMLKLNKQNVTLYNII